MKILKLLLKIIGVVILSLALLVAGYFIYRKIDDTIFKIKFNIELKKGQKVGIVSGKILSYSKRYVESKKDIEFGTYITQNGQIKYFGKGKRRFVKDGKNTISRGSTKLYISTLENDKIIKKIPFPKEYQIGYFDMSHDGRNIVFDAGKNSLIGDLYILEIVTGKINRLTNKIYADYPRFSPDDKKIVFSGGHINKEFPKTVYIMDLKTIEIRDILKNKEISIGSQPTWSTDGKRIAFVHAELDEKPKYTSIYEYNLETDELRRVTQEKMDCKYPCYSPDGKYLAYTAAKPGYLDFGSNIFAIDLEKGGAPIRITPMQKLEKFPRLGTDEYIDWAN